MAAYAVDVFSTEDAQYSVVMSSLETQLETLDSTSNPIRLISVVFKEDTGTFVGLLMTDA